MTCCQVSKHGVSAAGTAVDMNEILFYLYGIFYLFTASFGTQVDL